MDVMLSALPGRRSVLAGAASLALAPWGRAQAAAPRLLFGSGPEGEVARILSIFAAEALARGTPELGAAWRNTDTTSHNVRLLGTGEIDVGLAQVDLVMNAYEGDGTFRSKAIPSLRALAVMYSSAMHIVTVADRGIKSIRDLKGKRVNTGRTGAATEVLSARLLVAAGINRNTDLASTSNMTLQQALAAIAANQCDALFYSSGVPTRDIAAFGERADVQMVLVEHGNLAERVVARHGPVYTADLLPPGTYPDQATPYSHLSTATIFVTTEALPGAHAMALLNAIWDKRADLVHAHPDARKFTLDKQNNVAAGIPWHPAAEAFWRQKGAVLA